MSGNNQREKTTFMSQTIHQNFCEIIIDQNLWRVIVNCGFRDIETFDYGDYLGFIHYFPLFFFGTIVAAAEETVYSLILRGCIPNNSIGCFSKF